MEEFTVFIDETGDFLYGNNPARSFIGGWVCRGQSGVKRKIDKLLKMKVGVFNDYCSSGSLKFPDDLHFMPLHTPRRSRNKSDKHITIHPDQVKPFFTSVFDEVRMQTCFIFRSTGMPTTIAHEQAAYFEVLRNTLVQLVEDEFFPPEVSLQIIIAYRRKKELYGFAYKDPLDYERYLAGVLRDELKRFSRRKVTPDINIQFANARQHPGLMLADFFCGAQKKGIYLNKYQIKNYSFAKGFRVFPEIIAELQFLREDSPISAFMRGAQIFSGNSQNNSLRELLGEIYSEITADQNEKKYFFTTLKNHLNLILIENPARYRNLDEAESLIRLCQKSDGGNSCRMDFEELRLQAVFNLHKIRIASHRGRIGLREIVDHFNFLKRYHKEIFKNHLEYLQYKIDSILIMVQVAAFNTLQFDTILPHLQPIVDEYDKCFGEFTEFGAEQDENRAKLKGTIGQMYAFQYDLTKDEKLFFAAEQSLRDDVAACLEKSKAWEQGLGYLTTLYWHKGELEKAVEQFLVESGVSNSEKEIFDLGKKDRFGDIEQRPFIFLHRLYLCALAREKGEEVIRVDQCRRQLLQSGRLNCYPEFLSAKWLAVLLMQTNDFSSALELLELILKNDVSQGFTLDFIRLPIKLLKYKCLSEIGRQSSFSIDIEVEKLESQQAGAAAILEKLGLKKLGDDSKSWNPYEVALLMPFYYA